jgi:predicted nuclease of predicted toxin-antitoxin system
VRFLLDNDVPDRIADLLRKAGYSIVKLRELLPITTDDLAVFTHASEHGLILVTCNRDDFLPLATGGGHPGVIFLIRREGRTSEGAHLLRLIERAGESGLTGNINFA